MSNKYPLVLDSYTQTDFVRWLGKTFGNEHKQLARKIFEQLTDYSGDFQTFADTFSNGVNWERRDSPQYKIADVSEVHATEIHQIAQKLDSESKRQYLWGNPKYSMTSVIRWFYQNGYDRDQTVWFIREAGLTPAPHTIVCQFDSPSHREKSPAPISDDDKVVIDSILDGFEAVAKNTGIKEGGTKYCWVKRTCRGKVRQKKLDSVGDAIRCECCGDKPHQRNGDDRAVYAVDHIVPLGLDPERIRFTKDEHLRIVCWNCHATFTWGKTSFGELQKLQHKLKQ